MEFLEELEHAQSVAGVQQIGLLLEDILFEGSNVFESSVCLVCLVECEQGAAHLAID